MTSEIRFFDQTGAFLDVFSDLPTTPRSWVLNAYGRCEFSVPLNHDAAQEKLLRFGNFIHVKHIPTADNTGRLPDWTGVILTPRKWDIDAIHVTAYSIEGVLAYRAMPFVDKITGSPDQVFGYIMNYASARLAGKTPPIKPGWLDEKEGLYSDDLRTNAYDHIRKLIQTTGLEWDCHGEVNAGTLTLHTDLRYPSLTASGLSLTSDNTEEASPLLEEQGTIVNQIFGYSNDQTAADRVMQEIRNNQSIGLYGPWQINQTFIGVHDAAGIFAAANKTGDINGFAQRVFKRVALDVDDTFSYLRTGALVLVDEPRAGFNVNGGFGFTSLVRILSMDYNDTANKVNLTVEIPPVTGQGLTLVGPVIPKDTLTKGITP